MIQEDKRKVCHRCACDPHCQSQCSNCDQCDVCDCDKCLGEE